MTQHTSLWHANPSDYLDIQRAMHLRDWARTREGLNAPAASRSKSLCSAHAAMTASYSVASKARPMRMFSRTLAFWIHAVCAVYEHRP